MSAVSEIQRLVAEIPESDRRFRLYFTFSTYTIPVLAGILSGLLCAVMFDIAIGKTGSDKNLLYLVIAGVIISVTARVLFVARRQGKVWIELGEDGIRELDGDDLRLFVPWEDARAFQRAYRVRYGAKAAVTIEDHIDVCFALPSGERIFLTDHDAAGIFPKHRFRVVSRHRLGREKRIAELLPKLVDEVDPRDRREHGRWYGRFIGRVLAALLYATMYWFIAKEGINPNENGPSMPVPVRAIFAAMFGLTPLVLVLMNLPRKGVAAAAAPSGGAYRSAEVPVAPTAAFDRRAVARSRTYFGIRLALLAVAVLYPFVAGAVLMAKRN